VTGHPVPTIRTVLGDIPAGALGIALCHEHLLIDLKRIYQQPTDPAARAMAEQPVSLETLGWIRLNYANNRDNMGLYDEALVAEELALYRQAGGAALVEVTPVDIGRDPAGLVRIARATGIHVVMGTGYYVHGTHPAALNNRSVASLAEEMAGDIATGEAGTGIKAGIIGEIGCSWPLHPRERKVLEAAAHAQAMSGAALTIHPGRDPAAPAEILDIVAAAGGRPERTIMGHLDRTILDFARLKAFAERGSYLEFDMFGLESAYYPFAPIDMPNDGRRIDLIRKLIAAGHRDQILISHDIAFKHTLVKYGGSGYGHILLNAVPKMRQKGMSEDDIRAVLVDNPRRALALQA